MTMEPKIITIEKNTVNTKKPKHFKVVMHNDDYTTMEFVVDTLVTIFNKNTQEANRIMIDVHKKGIGVAGIYPYDIAVTKVSTAMSRAKAEGFPFKLTIEEV
jgi:ATP-dependent Clp protease adaptor protein ClpS